MLGVSHFLIQYGFLGVIGLGIGGFFGARWIRTKEGKYIFDSFMLRAPVFGPIIKKVNVARFARTFGSLMASGISVLEALQSTASALGNSVYQRELLALAEKVKNGKSLSEPLKESKHFPPLVAQMVAVGEETGQLDTILIKLAGFFEKEVDAVISGITSVIEPILILVIGTMVGLVVISVFGPISNLDNVVH
jgi:type IV pilus assembly protein PilC